MSYQAGSFRCSPQRQLPLFQSPGRIFGPSPTDHLIGDYRQARNAVPGWKTMHAAACAKLGQVNGHNPKWRRLNQRDAFRAINAIRAKMRANYRALETASAALLALGVSLESL